MALVAALTPLESAQAGDLQWTVATLASIIGLIEVEPGWLLANGSTIPSSGVTASGAPYATLFTRLGGRYGGAGILPNLCNARAPIPKGISSFSTHGATGGVTDVLLGSGHAPAHGANHSITVYYPTGPSDGAGNGGYCFQTGNFQFAPKTNVQNALLASGYSPGGSATHENMPPFFTVEGMLIKL